MGRGNVGIAREILSIYETGKGEPADVRVNITFGG